MIDARLIFGPEKRSIDMRLTDRVKPIGYLEAEAAQIVKDLQDTSEKERGR